MKIILDTSSFEKMIEQKIENIDRFIESVKAIKKEWKRIEDAIITRASALLPFKEFTEEITISIDIAEPDQNEETISIHPKYTSEVEAFVSKTAHKVHTILCYNMRQYDVDAIREEDKVIVRIVETINIEGIGDHIDIEYFLNSEDHQFYDGTYDTKFKITLRNIPKSIVVFDEIMYKISQDLSQRERLGEELREFTPSYGNPLGYYMANIIIKNAYLDELLKSIGNPFAFFKLYNKAVLKDREEVPSFSTTTIKLLEELEEKYVKAE